jgi:hypothetical protein
MNGHLLAFVAASALASACASDAPASSPLAPTAIEQPATGGGGENSGMRLANYLADATVIGRDGGGGCGWGTAPGGERAGVGWRIGIAGSRIELDEDMSNWPTDHIGYVGTLDGLEFTAAYWQGDDYLRYVCQFREATLVGRFSPDRSRFDAVSTLAWGPPDSGTVVQRRWSGVVRADR